MNPLLPLGLCTGTLLHSTYPSKQSSYMHLCGDLFYVCLPLRCNSHEVRNCCVSLCIPGDRSALTRDAQQMCVKH